jgi:hypothetical protein
VVEDDPVYSAEKPKYKPLSPSAFILSALRPRESPSLGHPEPPDLKTQLIVILGAATAGAWMLVWGLHLVRGGHTLFGAALLIGAVLLLPLGRRLLGGGGQWSEDARKPSVRKPWHW